MTCRSPTRPLVWRLPKSRPLKIAQDRRVAALRNINDSAAKCDPGCGSPDPTETTVRGRSIRWETLFLAAFFLCLCCEIWAERPSGPCCGTARDSVSNPYPPRSTMGARNNLLIPGEARAADIRNAWTRDCKRWTNDPILARFTGKLLKNAPFGYPVSMTVPPSHPIGRSGSKAARDSPSRASSRTGHREYGRHGGQLLVPLPPGNLRNDPALIPNRVPIASRRRPAIDSLDHDERMTGDVDQRGVALRQRYRRNNRSSSPSRSEAKASNA